MSCLMYKLMSKGYRHKQRRDSALRTRIRGDLILPIDPQYDTLRKVYNGMIDKHPAS
jgi:hypothetical protein